MSRYEWEAAAADTFVLNQRMDDRANEGKCSTRLVSANGTQQSASAANDLREVSTNDERQAAIGQGAESEGSPYWATRGTTDTAAPGDGVAARYVHTQA
jgi:hypothetical protein